MESEQEGPRDLAAMVVPQVGRLVATGDGWMPYRLVDDNGVSVEAVSAWFAELLALGRAEATVRSYGLDLLRWFPAPRGALTYPLLSREGLEVIIPGSNG
jgi:hypothetical protein